LRFETDLTWQTHLIELKSNGVESIIKNLANEPTAIICRVKNQPKEELLHIFEKDFNKKQFGNWMVYYNNN